VSHRFSDFFAPSAADRLLARAQSFKLELNRYPAEKPAHDDSEPSAETSNQSRVELTFELCGELPLDAQPAELLAAIVAELSQQKGGA
jgi:hypothetical protein